MGIDIYTKWDNMTESEKKGQMTGFSIVSGNVGYLREAYHGAPYATKLLLPEAFKAQGKYISISAAKLKARLPEALDAALIRERSIYKNKKATLKSKMVQTYVDFVKLIERLEKANKHPKICASY